MITTITSSNERVVLKKLFVFLASFLLVSTILCIHSAAPKVLVLNGTSFNEASDEFLILNKNIVEEKVANVNNSVAEDFELLKKKDVLDAIVIKDDNPTQLSLVPGDLPTYTGWARPSSTIAPYFSIISVPPTASLTNVKTSIIILCKHPTFDCSKMNSFFYSRAYGPSIINGVITKSQDGSYTIDFMFFDPGEYTIELVLSFSNAPDWSKFPCEDVPKYEGWLLPRFPLKINITEGEKQGKLNDPRTPLCQEHELMPSSMEFRNNPYVQGRWVLTGKVSSLEYQQNLFSHGNADKETTSLSLEGYRHGRNSLGIQLEYRKQNNCAIVPDSMGGWDLKHAEDKHAGGKVADYCCFLDTLNDNKKGLRNDKSAKAKHDVVKDVFHIIFIGDSVMERQYLYMKDYLGVQNPPQNIKLTLIESRLGIAVRLDDIKLEMRKIQKEFPLEKRYIMFNTGLHDVEKLCKLHKHAANTLNIPNGDSFRCSDFYKKKFTELVEFLNNIKAEKKIFRTTTAGWLRYGNYGFGWPTTKPQWFPMSSDFVHHFNEVALGVMQRKTNSFESFHIIDGYWITLARPDNTEALKENNIGAHIVHPGVEVISTMTRWFWTSILWDICS